MSRAYAKFFRKEKRMELVGLKKARKKRALSQLKVAMDLSITREALSHYENGKRSPDVDMLVKLARYFGVSVDYIIFGEDSPS